MYPHREIMFRQSSRRYEEHYRPTIGLILKPVYVTLQSVILHLGRLADPHINHQIYLKFSALICVSKKYHIVNINVFYLLNLGTSVCIFYIM